MYISHQRVPLTGSSQTIFALWRTAGRTLLFQMRMAQSKSIEITRTAVKGIAHMLWCRVMNTCLEACPYFYEPMNADVGWKKHVCWHAKSLSKD